MGRVAADRPAARGICRSSPAGSSPGWSSATRAAEAAFEDGEPVYGYPALIGCYAEYVTCPSEQMAPIPAGLTNIDAAAVPIDALTAQQGLQDHLGIRPGDTVLITAAAGGLGHLAVQIARALGANVIGDRQPHNHDFVHTARRGQLVVDHMQPDWPERVRALTGGGADKVLACAARRWRARPGRPGTAPSWRRRCTARTSRTGTGCTGCPTTASRAAAA